MHRGTETANWSSLCVREKITVTKEMCRVHLQYPIAFNSLAITRNKDAVERQNSGRGRKASANSEYLKCKAMHALVAKQ